MCGVTEVAFFMDKFRIIPRAMMIVMTCVYIRCIEWALAQPDLSAAQSTLISVVTAAMTGAFSVWITGESRSEGGHKRRMINHDEPTR